jgi:hypothetical protein
MNRFERFVRDALEKLLKRFHEGPEPPPRLRETVILWRVLNPEATIDAWEKFAISQAEDAYRCGFVRGLERNLRNPEAMPPEVADAIERARHDWSIVQSEEMRRVIEERVNPFDPLDGVPMEKRAEFFDEIGAYYGTHRVVVIPDDGNDGSDQG